MIITSNLSLLADQELMMQPPSTQKVSGDELVDRIKRATQEMLDAVSHGDKAVWYGRRSNESQRELQARLGSSELVIERRAELSRIDLRKENSLALR